MPINPNHVGSLTFLDHSVEKSAMQFNIPAITALNIAAFLADFGDFRTATEALSKGVLIQDSWTGDVTKYSAAPPADDTAHREEKWLVRFEDTVNLARGTVTIPVADASGQLLPFSDEADLTTAEWVAWIAAAETLLRSQDGNTINILGAQLVGRNN